MIVMTMRRDCSNAMVVRIQSPKKSTLESDLNSALCPQHSTAQCSWFLKRLINPMGMEITIQVMERMMFMDHDFSSSSLSSSSSSSSWEVEERNRILLEMEKRLQTQGGKAGSGSPTLKRKGFPGWKQQLEGVKEELEKSWCEGRCCTAGPPISLVCEVTAQKEPPLHCIVCQ